MIIYSFDCAVKNLGVCIAEIDVDWRKKVDVLADRLLEVETLGLDEIHETLLELEAVLDGMFKVLWVNTLDISGGVKARDLTGDQIMQRIKYVLTCIDSQMPRPSAVLIERQMKVNPIASAVSNFIQGYYTIVQPENTVFKALLEDFPLRKERVSGAKTGKRDPTATGFRHNGDLHLGATVHVVGAALKNSFQVDPSPAGAHGAFSAKYSNYTANKKHSTHNFKYYMERTEWRNGICGTKKLDDVSDAFMMALGWSLRKLGRGQGPLVC